MAVSLRTIQSAMNAGGFPVAQMNAFGDFNPTVLQNYLSGATGTVASSTALVDSFVSGNSSAGSILGNCLQIELGECESLAANNVWFIEGHVAVATGATPGVKVQLTTYDGLTLVTAASNVEFTLNVNGAVGGAGVVAVNSSFGAAVNAISIDFSGMIQIASGYGRIGLQFSQSVSNATTTSLGPFGYIRAEALLP